MDGRVKDDVLTLWRVLAAVLIYPATIAAGVHFAKWTSGAVVSSAGYLLFTADPNDYVICCCNFTPVPRVAYKIGAPEACWYEEISNSDSTFYGGSDVGYVDYPALESAEAAE